MKKFTQQEIANKLGITHSAVSQWFSGKTYPDIKKAFRLKDEFGIPLNAWRDISAYKNSTPSKGTITSLQGEH